MINITELGVGEFIYCRVKLTEDSAAMLWLEVDGIGQNYVVAHFQDWDTAMKGRLVSVDVYPQEILRATLGAFNSDHLDHICDLCGENKAISFLDLLALRHDLVAICTSCQARKGREP